MIAPVLVPKIRSNFLESPAYQAFDLAKNAERVEALGSTAVQAQDAEKFGLGLRRSALWFFLRFHLRIKRVVPPSCNLQRYERTKFYSYFVLTNLEIWRMLSRTVGGAHPVSRDNGATSWPVQDDIDFVLGAPKLWNHWQ